VRYADGVMRVFLRLLAMATIGAVIAGCASVTTVPVKFMNVTPTSPQEITAVMVRPDDAGPFPAVVQLHGCAGVEATSYRWARWFADHGYVALVVDSFTARATRPDCKSGPDEPPITARLDDAFGALRYLQSLPFVRGDRVAAVGWSQGAVYALAVINGPSLDRAKQRGVAIPAPGFAAAIGFYADCHSLIAEQVTRPLLVLIGSADDWTPAVKCEQMATAMRSRGADVTLVVYPGAYHYFDVEGQRLEVLAGVENDNTPTGLGATVSYQPAAAKDAYVQVERFLARHLKDAPSK
jgi:dienelactone hydrolase